MSPEWPAPTKQSNRKADLLHLLTAALVQVFGRRNDGLSTHSEGRRPKSAKARNRGLGTAVGATPMGISPQAQASMWSKVAATCTILLGGMCVN